VYVETTMPDHDTTSPDRITNMPLVLSWLPTLRARKVSTENWPDGLIYMHNSLKKPLVIKAYSVMG